MQHVLLALILGQVGRKQTLDNTSSRGTGNSCGPGGRPIAQGEDYMPTITSHDEEVGRFELPTVSYT